MHAAGHKAIFDAVVKCLRYTASMASVLVLLLLAAVGLIYRARINLTCFTRLDQRRAHGGHAAVFADEVSKKLRLLETLFTVFPYGRGSKKAYRALD